MFDMDTFKMVHSELIMSMQYIEQDLKLVYAAVKGGDFEQNFDELERMNLGKVINEFKDLDYKTGFAQFSEESYNLLNEIREIRNYWCHQCYLDFHYYKDPEEHLSAYRKVAERLHYDENRVYELQQKLEKLRKREIQKHNTDRAKPRTIKLVK